VLAARTCGGVKTRRLRLKAQGQTSSPPGRRGDLLLSICGWNGTIRILKLDGDPVAGAHELHREP